MCRTCIFTYCFLFPFWEETQKASRAKEGVELEESTAPLFHSILILIGLNIAKHFHRKRQSFWSQRRTACMLHWFYHQCFNKGLQGKLPSRIVCNTFVREVKTQTKHLKNKIFFKQTDHNDLTTTVLLRLEGQTTRSLSLFSPFSLSSLCSRQIKSGRMKSFAGESLCLMWLWCYASVLGPPMGCPWRGKPRHSHGTSFGGHRDHPPRSKFIIESAGWWGGQGQWVMV